MLHPQLTSDHESRTSSSSSGLLSPSDIYPINFKDDPTQHSNPGSATASDNDDVVEITLDLGDDSVMEVHSVLPAGGDDSPVASSTAPRSGSSCTGPRTDRSLLGSVHRLKGLNFVRGGADADWAAVEKRFNHLEIDGYLTAPNFGRCIGIEGFEEFALQLFHAQAWRWRIARDWITKTELRKFWDQITNTGAEIPLQTFFNMVVESTDEGRITEEDVIEVIKLSASFNKLWWIHEHVADYARLIMEELDPSNAGYIRLENLAMLMPQAPSQSVSQMLMRERLHPTAEPKSLRWWYQYSLEDNRKRVWVMLVWLSICAGLFTWKFVQYRRRYVFEVMGYCICVAKGGAEMLKFNMALILLPVCKNTITWIRSFTFVSRVVPLRLNDNLNFHKVVAMGIAVSAGLHILPHLTCSFPRLLRATDTMYAPLAQYFSTSRDWRPPSYWWFLRGTEGWTGLTMLALMAIVFTLALPSLRLAFIAFWYLHHLFVVVYALLIVHGHFLYLTQKWYNKSTWMYLAMPMVLYACERLIRALQSTTMLPVMILKLAMYPGNLLSLHFSKPHGFQYKSGQYISINCPAVSSYKRHRALITSAPQDNYLSIDIRTLGDWTREFKNILLRVSSTEQMEGGDATSIPRFPEVLIDGPYGSASQDYKKYEIVLLIGYGIGATPMISIINDIISNMKQLEGDLESGGGNNNSAVSSATSFHTPRTYFYWIAEEQGLSSNNWLRGVMDEVAETDKNGIIEFHSYFTGIYEEGDVRSALIAVVQSLNYAKNGVDIVSGTRFKAHFARPNWFDVYKRVALNHRDKCVGVFYCGPPVLGEEMRVLARHFSRKTTTKFDFHKENL